MTLDGDVYIGRKVLKNGGNLADGGDTLVVYLVLTRGEEELLFQFNVDLAVFMLHGELVRRKVHKGFGHGVLEFGHSLIFIAELSLEFAQLCGLTLYVGTGGVEFGLLVLQPTALVGNFHLLVLHLLGFVGQLGIALGQIQFALCQLTLALVQSTAGGRELLLLGLEGALCLGQTVVAVNELVLH